MTLGRHSGLIFPQPAEKVLKRRRDGLQHPREDVEKAPRALLATAAAVVIVLVLIVALAILVSIVFDLPLFLRVVRWLLYDDLLGQIWLGFRRPHAHGRIIKRW